MPALNRRHDSGPVLSLLEIEQSPGDGPEHVRPVAISLQFILQNRPGITEEVDKEWIQCRFCVAVILNLVMLSGCAPSFPPSGEKRHGRI